MREHSFPRCTASAPARSSKNPTPASDWQRPFTDIFFFVGGPMGLPDPPLVFMNKRGLLTKRIDVMVPDSGSSLRYQDFYTEDMSFGDDGNIEIQFTHTNLPVFRIGFPYWKRGRYKDECYAKARMVEEAIERARSDSSANYS